MALPETEEGKTVAEPPKTGEGCERDRDRDPH